MSPPLNARLTVLEFRELALIDMVTIIRDFKSSNSAGVNGITSRILKAGGPTLYPVIPHLGNSSFLQKTVPDYWKIGCVTPFLRRVTDPIPVIIDLFRSFHALAK